MQSQGQPRSGLRQKRLRDRCSRLRECFGARSSLAQVNETRKKVTKPKKALPRFLDGDMDVGEARKNRDVDRVVGAERERLCGRTEILYLVLALHSFSQFSLIAHFQSLSGKTPNPKYALLFVCLF